MSNLTYPIHFYRSRLKFCFAGGIGGAMFCVWLASFLGYLSESFGRDLYYSAFMTVCVLPTAIYLVILALKRQPVLSVFEDRIELHGIIFPWRQAMLQRRDILSVRTNWTPGISTSDLIFTVSDACFARSKTAKIWRTAKAGQLHFDFSNMDRTPDEAVEIVRCYVEHQ